MLKTKTTAKIQTWNLNIRSRVGDSVTHLGSTWVNITGSNSEPGVGTDWEFIGSTSQVSSSKENFTSTAAQTDFILSSSPDNVDVIVDRLYQLETIDYNLAGNTVTMTVGLDLGSKVEIRKF